MLCLLQQHGVGLEAGRQPLHLSENGAAGGVAAIDVVIAQLRTDNNILDADALAMTTGTASGDDDLRMELVDETLGTEGGVDLTYAALDDADVGIVGKELLQLKHLPIHSYNNSYFHTYTGLTPIINVIFTFTWQSYDFFL